MTDNEKLLKLRKLADAMYYAAQQLTTDASRLHKAMEDYHRFVTNEYHKEEPTIPDIVDEHYWEMLGEEPVSEELEEAAKHYLYSNILYDDVYVGNPTDKDCIEMFKAGAQWKEEQFEKNRLKHCDSITNEQAELEQGFIDQHLDKYNRMPTFLDAIEYGMKLHKKQLMKDAMEGVITFDYYGDGDKTYGCVAHDSFCLEDLGLKDTDKVKIVFIKED